MARQRLEVALDEADVQALRQVDKKSDNWRARERARTLLLLGQGKSLEEVAQSQDITTRTVRNTWARWCRDGLDALVDKPRCGAPRKLDEAALERLTQWANDKPLTALQLLQRHIEEQGTPVHVNTEGGVLVEQAGVSMQRAIAEIQRVTSLMHEISNASHEQSAGVRQIGEAITHMDETTQQNATLVEEMASAANSLKQQADDLVKTVSVFKLSSYKAG